MDCAKRFTINPAVIHKFDQPTRKEEENMKKRILAMFLILALAFSCLAGCGSKDGDGGSSSGNSNEKYTVDIYDVAANFQGVQTGWFAKVVEDRFNLELNIIAPQVAGDEVYAARTSAGNLGDIVLLDQGQFQDCVKAGLIKDISKEIANCPNLMNFKTQIDTFNTTVPDANGAIYGIPTEMANTSATSYSQDTIASSPLLRWDLYKAVGSPEIKDLNGLLDVLAEMKEKFPTNDKGDACYPLSLWPDWDGGDGMLGIANVVQLTTWYGEKIKGSQILKPDNTFTPLTDKSASYYKMLKFLNDANRRGLVDPDSFSQDWNSACEKMSTGRVYLFWYSWQVGFWNSQERLENGTAMRFIPVTDQSYYAEADAYYGSGRVFAVGSGVTGDKYDRITKFLDWYASPEGCEFQHAGIKDFNYSLTADGKFKRMNDNALMDNLPVPEEYGGAGYSDGNNAINQWIVASYSTNPNTGETYASAGWSTFKEETMTNMKKEWQEKFGALEDVEWMKNNNKLVISPNVAVTLPTDNNDIGLIRNQCSSEINTYSWKMIQAKDDAEFDALWDEMTKVLDGKGFQELLKFDLEKDTIELNAKLAAAGK